MVGAGLSLALGQRTGEDSSIENPNPQEIVVRILQPWLALAFVACGALFLAGCADPQAKDNKDLVAKADDPSLQGRKRAQPAPAETKPTETKAAEKNAPTIPLDKWGFTAVEKAWSLKLKSVSGGRDGANYTLVVEFTKDLMPEELEALKGAFPPATTKTATTKEEPKKFAPVAGPKVVAFFFDEDNVVVEKQTTLQALTEVTGVKGDAFRLQIQGPSSGKGEVRAELRLIGEPTKPKRESTKSEPKKP